MTVVKFLFIIGTEAVYSVVGIATGYGLDDQGVTFRAPVGSKFSFLHVVQIDSGAHPAPHPMGTGSSFSGCKVTEA
jgi:hypothetical protein